MRVLFDTNVVLDVLLAREPFARAAGELFARVERGELQGVLGATTLTTIYYLIAKALTRESAKESVRKLLALFEVAAVNRSVIESALEVECPDFEDAVLCEAGRQQEVDIIVTRNVTDFSQTRLAVYTPIELLAVLSAIADTDIK
jgi:predicted nucleic acid-binding protein